MHSTDTPIATHKVTCKNIAPPGWVYGGFDDGFYFFQAGNYKTGFKVMDCLEKDLTTENLALMAKHGFTLDRSATRKRVSQAAHTNGGLIKYDAGGAMMFGFNRPSYKHANAHL
jgi:hypothetical protein